MEVRKEIRRIRWPTVGEGRRLGRRTGATSFVKSFGYFYFFFERTTSSTVRELR